MAEAAEPADVDMPSPKRRKMALQESTTALGSSNASLTVDEFDDVYSTSNTPAEHLVHQIQPNTTTSVEFSVLSAPNRQLPGLGLLETPTEPLPIGAETEKNQQSASPGGHAPDVPLCAQEVKAEPERVMYERSDASGKDAELQTPTGQQQDARIGVEMGSDPHDNAELTVAQLGVGVTTGELPATSEVTLADIAEAVVGDDDAEFELDSSPLQSSSSDTSSDDSSSDESDADDYQLLSPEEQARLLMAEEGGSDEDGPGKGGRTSGPLRTLNEKPDEPVPKPDLVVSEDMKIEELGNVENTVENLVLIKAKTSGEYQVLESGSVLCLEDKTVIGVVADTLGRVQQPYYSVRFTNAAAIAEAGISPNTRVFYVEKHSTYVFTQALKAVRGSDASNLHDEEVGDDEMEFSDDEAEAEHKRTIKMQKQAKRNARDGEGDGFSRPPRPRGRGGPRQRGTQRSFSNGLHSLPERPPDPTEAALNYDDAGGMHVDGDDPYTPLSRPTNLHEMMGPREAPLETQPPFRSSPRGGHSRDNNNRGRGRGDRGGHGRPHFSRGSDQGGGPSPSARGNHAHPQPNGLSHPNPQPPTHPHHHHPPHHHQQQQQQPISYQPPLYPHHHHQQQQQQQPYTPFPHQYTPQQPSYPQFPQQAYPPPSSASLFSPSSFPNPLQMQMQMQMQTQTQMQAQTQTPVPTSPTAGIPPGAHVNPAFFRQQGDGRGGY